MAIFIEGIGGTGKAVVNLVSFVSGLAKRVEEPTPDLSCVVTDQDDQGVWPGTKIRQAAPGVSGRFQDVLQLTDDTKICAAGLLYSPEELSTDVSMGFHGRPKLLATLRHLGGSGDESHLPTHVVIYSDIGGTGAGLGPVRLQRLVSTSGKRNVIAIVFGKYLNRGAMNPTGFRWLTDEVRLPGGPGERYFTATYISVPMLDVTGDTPPQSGLNPTPALLWAADYIWKLGLLDDAGIDEMLALNDRAERKERVERLTGTDAMEALRRSSSFLGRVRRAAVADDLRPILKDRRQEYLHRALTTTIQSDELSQQAWTVFGARDLNGSGDAAGEDLNAAFGETFKSVPDAWAAAKWFHIGVARNVSRCRDAFLRLVLLYLQGKIHIVPLDWSPESDGDRIYALCTEKLRRDDADFRSRFQQSVVGAFSERYPFWTTPACESRLLAQQITRELRGVRLLIGDRSPCAAAFFPNLETDTDIPNTAGLRGTLTLTRTSTLDPSPWSWVLETHAKDWAALMETVEAWPVLGHNLSVQSSSRSFTGTSGTHACDVSGVRQVTTLLKAADGIYVSGQRGLEFYEMAVSDRNGHGTPRVSRERRLVIDEEQGQTTPVLDASRVDVLIGNVVTRVTLSA